MAYLTPEGTWRVQWTDKTGRRRSETFPKGTPKKDVDNFERRVRLAMIDRSLVENCPTVDEYKDRFLKVWQATGGRRRRRGKLEGALASSTMLKYRQDIENHIVSRFGDWKLCDIRVPNILDWQAELYEDGEGLDAQTCKNIVGVLSSMFNLAILEELVQMNPCSIAPRISGAKKEPVFWTQREKDDFLSYAIEHDFELFQLALFACDTGARPGELAGLLGDCLDLREGFVVFRRTFCTKTRKLLNRTKNGVSRKVWLNADVLQVLRNKCTVGPDDRVFPLNFNTLPPKRLYPACEAARVRRLHMHGWRHTFASHLVMAGKNFKEIQDALGHTKLATTMDTYAHLTDDHRRSTTDGLNVGARWKQRTDVKVVPLHGRH